MIKRIIAFVLVFVVASLLLCNAAYAAIYDEKTSVILPQFSRSCYAVCLRLANSVPNNSTYHAYIAIYNKNNRMIDVQYRLIDNRRLYFDIVPKEYPATVRAFVWSANKTGIPFAESYTYTPELKAANLIITEQLENFVSLLKSTYKTPGNFMYELTSILDSIDEDIINDARNEELVIDKEHFQKEYPEAYAKVEKIAKELKQSGGINDAISNLSLTINDNKEYEQLALTLFALLGVYDYF